jgi:hypothetical protein
LENVSGALWDTNVSTFNLLSKFEMTGDEQKEAKDSHIDKQEASRKRRRTTDDVLRGKKGCTCKSAPFCDSRKTCPCKNGCRAECRCGVQCKNPMGVPPPTYTATMGDEDSD